MAKSAKKLLLFEAIELRNEFDRTIKLLEKLLGTGDSGKDMRFFRDSAGGEEKREPAAGFDPAEWEETLRKNQTKRLKLNQAIQEANFETKIEFKGEKISITEALEIRKKLLTDQSALSQRVMDSAYKRIIHKEGRDIVHDPRHPFQKTIQEFQSNAGSLRQLINLIHMANHGTEVKFRDE